MRLRLQKLQKDDANVQKLRGQKDYKEYDNYVCRYDGYMRSKTVQHKLYGNPQALPIFTHKWKNLFIDFVTRLLIFKDWR